MSDVFQEVDQSLREESLARVWKRWQWVVYGVVAVAIIGVVVFEVTRGIRNAEIANAAKAGCVISRALAVPVTLEATLV